MSKAGVISLHSRCRAEVAISHYAVDHIEATTLPLVQPQLKVGSAGPWEILGAPFDVENPVGRSARNRGEDPIATVYGVQILPIREDRVVMTGPR